MRVPMDRLRHRRPQNGIEAFLAWENKTTPLGLWIKPPSASFRWHTSLSRPTRINPDCTRTYRGSKLEPTQSAQPLQYTGMRTTTHAGPE